MDETTILAELASPFPPSQINWKVQSVSKDQTKALAVPYIDARDVAERLDNVVGPMNWQVDHKAVGDQTMTGIGIRSVIGVWIWKWDTGLVEREDDEAMSVKGSLSDGLKRAAVLWGIGRYLYRFPKTWVAYDPQRKRLLEIPKIEGPQLEKPASNSPPAAASQQAKGEIPDGAAPIEPTVQAHWTGKTPAEADVIFQIKKEMILPEKQNHPTHIMNILNKLIVCPTDAPDVILKCFRIYVEARKRGLERDAAIIEANAGYMGAVIKEVTDEGG